MVTRLRLCVWLAPLHECLVSGNPTGRVDRPGLHTVWVSRRKFTPEPTTICFYPGLLSLHSYHHMHADTPLDPHTPQEGIWQAYMGWLFQQDKWRAVLDRSNVDDMKADKFQVFINESFAVWMILRFGLTYVSPQLVRIFA